MSHGHDLDSPDTGMELVPTLTDAELRQLHAEGIQRVGIVALLVDSERQRMLLLEHTQSEKSQAGMWGALGETALVATQGDGWKIEAPMDTLARGLQEELKVPASTGQLWVPRRLPFFSLEWPVGVNSTDTAFAICPVVVVSDELAAAIGNAEATEEVSTNTFTPIDQASAYDMRPGMERWLPHAIDAIDKNAGSGLVVVHLPVDELQGQTQDAILDNMYGHAA